MYTFKVLRQKEINPAYEIVVAKEGVEKLPTLDFNEEEVDRISDKIVRDFLEKFLKQEKSEARSKQGQ
jgi:uncharacterized metal-binding protein